jgi:hypothetical protein
MSALPVRLPQDEGISTCRQMVGGRSGRSWTSW